MSLNIHAEILFKLIHPDDVKKVRNYLDRLTKKKGGMSEVEMRLQRKNGYLCLDPCKGQSV